MIRAALFVITVLAALQALAQESKFEFKPTPWHLVDLWWDIGQESPFESYSIDVDISDDMPSSESLHRPHRDRPPQQDSVLRRHPNAGWMATPSGINTFARSALASFSPCGASGASMPSGPPWAAFCQSSGHEGDFVSVRRPYEWKKGKFTYKVVRMDKEEIDGKPFTWVGVFVYSHDKDENVFVGALRFPGENLVLAGKVASFVEVYGPRIPVSEIPKVMVTFGNLTVNGKPVKVATAEAIYPKKVPDYAEAVAAKDETYWLSRSAKPSRIGRNEKCG